MAHTKRQTNRLSAAFCRTAKDAGKYCDGGSGLYLMVTPSGSKSFMQRLSIHGRRHDLGLGGYPLVTLAEARAKAFANQKLARDGGDPLALKRRPNIPTFAAAVESVITIHEGNWNDGRTADEWRASLRDYAMPKLGRMRVDQVTMADVMAVLQTPTKDLNGKTGSLWNIKRETARRVRQRIGAVMNWSIAQGFRTDNPAGDALGTALPRNGVIKKHQRALPYDQVAAALATVRASSSGKAAILAFDFLVLTACRSSEVRLAQWKEIDLDAACWTIPAERMKAKREHRVPLSPRAVEILTAAQKLSDGSGLVFPSPRGKPGRPFTSKTLLDICTRSGIDAVPHGFRSSFRDWASERTNTPAAIMEAALAHANKNQVEAAYARSDLFEKRRKLMDQWTRYLEKSKAKVVRLHG